MKRIERLFLFAVSAVIAVAMSSPPLGWMILFMVLCAAASILKGGKFFLTPSNAIVCAALGLTLLFSACSSVTTQYPSFLAGATNASAAGRMLPLGMIGLVAGGVAAIASLLRRWMAPGTGGR